MAKKWNKIDKDQKIKDLKIPLKRKLSKNCTPEEYDMIYGNPDWEALELEQNS